MKRVWIIDETLSPACFIYYTLAFPTGNSVSCMCGHYLVSKSESFQGCASNILNGIAGNIGEREELRLQRVGQHGIDGDKRGGEIFSSPPLPRFPSASPYTLYVLIHSAKTFLAFLGKKSAHTYKKTQSCLWSRLITPNI